MTITTQDRTAEFDLFETSSLDMGLSKGLGEGVEVTYQGTLVRKALNIPSAFELTISGGVGVAGSLVANVIWDWLKKGLKKRPESIEIDRVVVEFEEGAVKRLIVEKLRRHE